MITDLENPERLCTKEARPESDTEYPFDLHGIKKKSKKKANRPWKCVADSKFKRGIKDQKSTTTNYLKHIEQECREKELHDFIKLVPSILNVVKN